jgi:DNA-binding response OmpR family regulator
LIVDDEESVRKVISRILENEGMLTFQAGGGAEALRLLQEESFDLIILDISMEGIDGFTVINQMRGLGLRTPVFVLSGLQGDHEKVLALGIGADDYITKPFSMPVLSAKVKACLRRTHVNGGAGPGVIRQGPLKYLTEEMRLFMDGEEIFLSGKEGFLIRYFLLNPGKVLTKEQIYCNVWNNQVVDDKTIMVYIHKLRAKIEKDPNRPVYLKTVWGVGYQFVAPKE